MHAVSFLVLFDFSQAKLEQKLLHVMLVTEGFEGEGFRILRLENMKILCDIRFHCVTYIKTQSVAVNTPPQGVVKSFLKFMRSGGLQMFDFFLFLLTPSSSLEKIVNVSVLIFFLVAGFLIFCR